MADLGLIRTIFADGIMSNKNFGESSVPSIKITDGSKSITNHRSK